MNSRTLITVLVLAIAALSTGLLLLQRNDDSVSQGERFLPVLADQINNVDQLRIVLPGERTLVTLEKQGDRWLVANRGGYPAEIGKVRELLLKLAEARVLEAKTAKPELYDRLGVSGMENPDALGARLDIKAGERRWSVIVGNRPTNVTAGTYVRRADQAQSLLVDTSIPVRRGLGDWIPREVIDLDLARLQRVVIAHPDGATVEIGRGNPGEDFSLRQPAEAEARPADYLRTTADALGGLRLQDVQAADDAPFSATAVATYATFDGLIIAVQAATDEAGNRIALQARTAEGVTDQAIRDEAASLNARLNGWRFELPGGRIDRFIRRPEDVTAGSE